VVVAPPPVALLSDANLLAGMIDVALIVVGASTTPYPLVKKAVEAIGVSRVLGVILNRADRSTMAGEYGYYYGYGYSYRYGYSSRAERRYPV
jgi:Mrp family chromosome partitioning ATPase